MSTIHQPHDKLFKLSMSEPQVAQDFLRAYLPSELLREIDLSTVKLEKESFLDDAYKANEADVVLSLQLKKRLSYIFILCEQQTEVDPWKDCATIYSRWYGSR